MNRVSKWFSERKIIGDYNKKQREEKEFEKWHDSELIFDIIKQQVNSHEDISKTSSGYLVKKIILITEKQYSDDGDSWIEYSLWLNNDLISNTHLNKSIYEYVHDKYEKFRPDRITSAINNLQK